LVTDGPAKNIYMKYGWKKPFKTEKEIFDDKINFVKQRGSKEGLDKLLKCALIMKIVMINGFNIFLLEIFVKC